VVYAGTGSGFNSHMGATVETSLTYIVWGRLLVGAVRGRLDINTTAFQLYGRLAL
jgi:hypothetical protein